MYAKIPDGLPSLNAAFNDPTCRVLETFMFVDVENSTRMQSLEPEASWLPQTAFFYDLCDRVISEATFPIHAKFLGDGIMLTAETEHATEMVNLAILIQEAIRRNGPKADGSPGAIAFNVSIGIVTGNAVRFLAPDGLVDFVGKTTSSARRLCDAATARGIFIDLNTAGSIVPIRISSEIGRVQNREFSEYLGDINQTEAKGLSVPLQYHEILWESNRFGRKNEAVSPPSSSRPNRGAASVAGSGQKVATLRRERCSGKVKVWGAEKGFGFVTGHDGEEFYLNKALLAYDEDADALSVGTLIAFTTLPARVEGKLRQAAVALVDGKDASGRVSSVPTPERPYGWIEVADDHGTSHSVHVSGTEFPASARKGDEVDFTVRVSPRGASATDVELCRPQSGDDQVSAKPAA